MPKGRLLSITREAVEAMWNDPDLRVGEIADRLGCGREALRRRAIAWGLPPRPKAKHKPVMSLVGQPPSGSGGQRGHPLCIKREVLEPLWLDPRLSIKVIAEHFHVSSRALSYYAPRLGLPLRSEVRGWWRDGNCDRCRCRELCNGLQATAEPFPCQVAAGAEWDVEEMQVRRDGDRVGASNFGAAGRVNTRMRDE